MNVILFLRKNKDFLKIKPIEVAAGITNSALVSAVDDRRPLAEKHHKKLEAWAQKFFAGAPVSGKVPSQDLPKKPVPAAKPSAAPKSKAPEDQKKPLRSKNEPAGGAETKARIAELEKELKNPPKNPAVGLKMWKKVREDELKRLKG